MTFISSSALSNDVSQYCFFSSSSACSLPKSSTISSIIFTILSKFAPLRPFSASINKFIRESPARLRPARSVARARWRSCFARVATCRKDGTLLCESAGLGNVFLNSSSASSSFKSLIVSAIARSSSARSFWWLSQTLRFSSQSPSICWRSFSFASSDFDVSSMSSSSSTISRPFLPRRAVLDSIASPWASISLVFAALRPS
mmetsp:Transcript_89825/g.175807  ORF Transcript_89825/g.175807 Transcript_89825/m.175807 type:complete len:202 (-) Transcript_89825:245-850(-)